jgi:O-antigen/teichoic acid export membrane protein
VAARPETGEPTDILDTGRAGGLAIRGSAMRAGGYLAGALVTLISVPLLVRHLGVEDFGRYSTVISLVAIVAGVTEGGLGAVSVREYAALDGSARYQFMRDVLGARIALTSVGLAGALVFAIAADYASDLVLGTLLAGVGLLIGVIQGTYFTPLAAGLRLGWITLSDLLRAIASATLVVVGVLAGAGIVPFLAIPIATSVLLLVVALVLVRGQVPLIPFFHPARWLGVLRVTLPLAISTAIGTLYFRLAIIVMSLIATAAQTGYFATSYRLVEALAGIPVMLVGVTFPILARAGRDDPERLRFAVQRIFEVGLILGVYMSLATALGATFAMQVIGGDEAAPAANVLEIQALYLTPLFLNLTWQTTLLALRMHREMLISALVALVTMVVLTFTLIPSLDAEGAAIAVVVGESVLASVEGWLLWRVRPKLRPELRVLPRVLAAAAIAVAAGLALNVHDVIRVAVASIAFFGVLAAVRGIPTELLPALLGRPPKASS